MQPADMKQNYMKTYEIKTALHNLLVRFAAIWWRKQWSPPRRLPAASTSQESGRQATNHKAPTLFVPSAGEETRLDQRRMTTSWNSDPLDTYCDFGLLIPEQSASAHESFRASALCLRRPQPWRLITIGLLIFVYSNICSWIICIAHDLYCHRCTGSRSRFFSAVRLGFYYGQVTNGGGARYSTVAPSDRIDYLTN